MRAPVLFFLAASAPSASAYHEVESSVSHAANLDDISVCHWRNTGACSKSGPREPKNDHSCGWLIANGASGFCDCNGNDVMDAYDPGYNCADSTPKTCNDACKAAAPATPQPTQATPAPTPEATPEPTPEAVRRVATPAPPPTPPPAPTPVPANPAIVYRKQIEKFNVMHTFQEAIQSELNNSKYPPVIAVIALIFGIVLLFNGERSLNLSVTFATAIIFGIIAKQAAKSYWEQHHTEAVSDPNTIANLTGLEVGLVVAAGAHYGNKGMLVAIGAAAGFFVAHFVSQFAVDNFHFDSMNQVEFQVVWYSVICLASSFAVYTGKHLSLMAFVTPIPGGVFTASALLYFVTEAYVGFSCKHSQHSSLWHSESVVSCPGNFTPKTGQWISFFNLAFDKTRATSLNDDVGIFYNNTWNFKSGSYVKGHATEGNMILVDHVVTVALWILLTLWGIKAQRASLKKRREMKFMEKGARNMEKRTKA